MLEIRKAPIATSRDVKQAYDALYADAGIQQLDSFYLWILDLLRLGPADRGARLLDVSCGQGRLVHFARQRGLRAVGIDLAETAVIRARQQHPGLAVAAADAERLPFRDASFDLVTNIGSLEHYVDPAAGVREMARVLRPGGRALVLVPNTFGLLWNVYKVCLTGAISDDGQVLQRYGTRRAWSDLLEGGGFAIDRVTKYDREWPRTAADLWFYGTHLRKLVALVLSPFVPVNLGGCLVFLLRRPG